MPGYLLQNTEINNCIIPCDVDLEGIWQAKDSQSGIVSLSGLSLIQVTGEDAENFLQGQFSNDLSLLSDQHCQLNAYCNPKGRTLAVIRLIKHNNGFLMLVPEDVSEVLVNRLKMFVLRAKVDIQSEKQFFAVGVVGNTQDCNQDFASYAISTQANRRLFIIENDRLDKFVISSSEFLHHFDLWRWLDIRSGIPQVYKSTMESFIPQTINLDLVDGINFKKGCFPGQEIVARIRYLGKLKQRMVYAQVETDEAIGPGTEIFRSDKPENRCGSVVDAVNTAKGVIEMSVMVPVDQLENGDLTVGTSTGPSLRRLKLPYSFS